MASRSRDDATVRQTFSSKFTQLSPERRARITFGVDKMHRQYLASNGGVSTMPYDAAEYLRDEATIAAYLNIVRQEAGADEYAQALAVAERARDLLAGSTRQGTDAPESKSEHNSMPGPEEKSWNWFRRLLPGGRSNNPLPGSAQFSEPHSRDPGLNSAAVVEERIDTGR
jgi:hypothetical protein